MHSRIHPLRQEERIPGKPARQKDVQHVFRKSGQRGFAQIVRSSIQNHLITRSLRHFGCHEHAWSRGRNRVFPGSRPKIFEIFQEKNAAMTSPDFLSSEKKQCRGCYRYRLSPSPRTLSSDTRTRGVDDVNKSTGWVYLIFSGIVINPGYAVTIEITRDVVAV